MGLVSHVLIRHRDVADLDNLNKVCTINRLMKSIMVNGVLSRKIKGQGRASQQSSYMNA